MPNIPAELRGIRSLTPLEIGKLIAKYARMEPDEVDACIEARRVSMIELVFARIFQESAAKGDFTRISFLLDRSIGKVPVIEPTTEEAQVMREIRDLSDQELVRIVKDKIPELEEK